MIQNKLLHGADYNPEQWLKYPEILAQDIEIMKKANMNCVSLNIFGWSVLEPQEGEYHFEHLDRVMDALGEAGIMVALSTPSGAMPHWLTNKYPEVLQTKADRRRNLPGERQNFCYTSPLYRKKVASMNRLLAERYANHKALMAWHISNEYANNSNEGECHCEMCQAAFRTWLKEKYGDLETLNETWWSNFWSHTYTDWDQIQSPSSRGESRTHGLDLDWHRFVTHQTLEFCKLEQEPLKKVNPNVPITVNLMETFKPLNYDEFAPYMDVISYDSYPEWHMHEHDKTPAVCAAFNYNTMRSLKGQNFLLMESTPSIVNWKPRNVGKRPGMHMLSSMQAVAHGSDSVIYFQFRGGRGAVEKFHGTVIGHDQSTENRVFKQVAEIGTRLEGLNDLLKDTTVKSEVAMIFDWENWWALETANALDNDISYVQNMFRYYAPIWEMGINTDMIPASRDLSPYKVVIAPLQYAYSEKYAKKVEAFVCGGGIYVGTYWSGVTNENDLCYLGATPGHLTEVFGLVRSETDCISPYTDVKIKYEGKSYQCKDIVERFEVKGATVIGTYEDKFYPDFPAMTEHQYHDGTSYFIGADVDSACLEQLYERVFAKAGIQNGLGIALPTGVTVSTRSGEKEIFFVQNFNEDAVEISLNKAYIIAKTGEQVDKLVLDRYDCKILH